MASQRPAKASTEGTRSAGSTPAPSAFDPNENPKSHAPKSGTCQSPNPLPFHDIEVVPKEQADRLNEALRILGREVVATLEHGQRNDGLEAALAHARSLTQGATD